MTNAMDDLYLRANTQTIDAADHNTVVQASQFLYANNLRGYPLGDGRDGAMCLGVIAATTTTAPTMAIASGSGNLTGTFYYKVSAYNLSGETAASSASSSISPSAQAVNVTIPATGSNTNITGFYIYRSTSSGGTYYRVGQLAVADSTNGGVFYDNNPITSGTAPQGSNTSTTTATIDGFYQATSFTMASGQTITITNNTPVGLYIVSQGAITIPSGATINGSEKHSTAPVIGYGWIGSQNNAGGTNGSYNAGGGYGLLKTTSSIKSRLLDFYNTQGSGSDTSYSATVNAGSSLMMISGAQITISGTVTLSGKSGTATTGEGGGAGGTFGAIAPIINRSGATITCNGGAGGTSASLANSGGGGGGVVAWVADNITGSATVSVAAGALGVGGGGSPAGGGGGNGGNGSNAGAGIVGISADIDLRTFDLRA